MANTTKLEGRFLQIKGLDADWSVPGDLPGFQKTGLRVVSIRVHPSAASDVSVIKQGKSSQTATTAAIATTTTAPEIFRAKHSTDQDDRIEYYDGSPMWPFIDISDWTLGTAANARVEMVLA